MQVYHLKIYIYIYLFDLKLEDDDSDLSPPRQDLRILRIISSYSPPQKFSKARVKRYLESRKANLSPGRSKSNSPDNEDLSPVRQKSKLKEKKREKTLDGKIAGLQDAKLLKEENEKFRKKENEMFKKISNEISGRNAEPIVRDKRGRNFGDLEKQAEKYHQEKVKEKQRKELYDKWNKGVKQIEDYKNKIESDKYESSKPLARFEDDADLERMLKEKERSGDPMLDYIRQKKRNEEKDERKSFPKYIGSYPENRFKIPPGYRWDGVDRSNGYEQKFFNIQNEKRARQEDSYKYSTEDM